MPAVQEYLGDQDSVDAVLTAIVERASAEPVRCQGSSYYARYQHLLLPIRGLTPVCGVTAWQWWQNAWRF